MANKVYSYVRVSTQKQNVQRQIDNIKAYLKGESSIQFEDKYTGTTMNRPEFDKLVKAVDKDINKGDNVTIIFDSVSRMSRNAAEGIEQYFTWYNKGVELVFLNEQYINTSVFKAAMQKQIATVSDTGDKATDKFIGAIVSALEDYQKDLAIKQIELAFEQSQKEVDDLRKRTAQGMAAKGAADKIRAARLGQEFVTGQELKIKIAALKELKVYGGVLNQSQFAKQHDISRMTVNRYLHDIKDDMNRVDIGGDKTALLKRYNEELKKK